MELPSFTYLEVQEKMTMKSTAERRATFAREPARSASVPPRKKWFRRSSFVRVQSHEVVCDDITRRLVGAITTWHDIHSNLLRLSIDRSDCSSLSEQSMESSSSEENPHGMLEQFSWSFSQFSQAMNEDSVATKRR
ncbi:hypothetical protein COOONC_10228 [Cooperia oncophora]